MLNNRLLAQAPAVIVGVAMVLIFSLLTVTERSYSYGALVLLLGGLIWCRSAIAVLDVVDKRMLLGFLSFSTIYFFIALYHREPLYVYEMSIKFLALCLIFMFLRRYPPNPLFFFACCAVGAIASAGLASFQVFFADAARAATFHDKHNAIFFGSIALCLSWFSAVGFIFASQASDAKQYVKLLKGLMALGAVLGLLAVLLSGSRGVWLALPLYGIGLCVLCRLRWVYAITALVMMVLATWVIWHFGLLGVAERLEKAMIEFQHYANGDQAAAFSSVGVRLELWKSGWYLIQQQPIFGAGEVGSSAAKWWLAQHGVVDKAVLEEQHWHNLMIDFFVKQGAVGLFGLSLLFLVPIALFYQQSQQAISRQPRILAEAGIVMVLFFVVFSLTDIFLTFNVGTIFYGVLISTTWSILRCNRC